MDNSEFNIGSRSADLGGASVNVARFGNAVQGSGAEGRWDLVTVLLHEMEHSVAYNAGESRYYDRVDYNPDASFVIPTSLTGLPATFDVPLTPGSHIDGHADNGLYNDAVIADPGFYPGQRALLTSVDIYGACYIAGCSRSEMNINPYQTVSPVPLPATGNLMITGLAALFGFQVFRRSSGRAMTKSFDA